MPSLNANDRRYLNFKEDLPLPPAAISPKASATSANQPWKLYHELSKSLGSIFLLPRITEVPFPLSLVRRLLHRSPFIVLNDAAGIVELFQKRSEVFSDRPRFPMGNLLGRQENVGFMHYGSKLTKARKLLHREFNSSHVSNWDFVLKDGVSRLMNDLADQRSSSNARQALKMIVEQIVFRPTWGAEATSDFFSLIEEVNRQTGSALQRGRWLVNELPWLEYIPPWFPYANFQRWARDAKLVFPRLVEEPFLQVKHDMTLNVAKPSFVHNRLVAEGTGSPEKLIMSTAGSIFSAGVDTNVALLETIFVLLARNTSLQERIYAQLIDQGFDSRQLDLKAAVNLPIIQMVMKEGLRFNPPIPLLTHSPTKDAKYDGWSIPRRSWVTANIWSIMHDPTIFTDPEEFNPERFLDPQLTDPASFAFGLGRRKCPGAFLAHRFVCMVIARTISLYKLMPLAEICKPIEFTTGLSSGPVDFDCVFVPRIP